MKLLNILCCLIELNIVRDNSGKTELIQGVTEGFSESRDNSILGGGIELDRSSIGS